MTDESKQPEPDPEPEPWAPDPDMPSVHRLRQRRQNALQLLQTLGKQPTPQVLTMIWQVQAIRRILIATGMLGPEEFEYITLLCQTEDLERLAAEPAQPPRLVLPGAN